MAKSSANKPVHEIRMGRIKAAIWENETQNGVRHNVTCQRIYKEDGGEWKSSDSFGRDDLPLLSKVVDLAHTWIYEHAAASDGPKDRF
jgi:hypothetical protein